MNYKEAIQSIKKEAAANPAVNATLHMFAMRQRARSQITVAGLVKSMRRERFDFKPSQYGQVLKVLAANRVGTLVLDAKGRPKALKDIKVTLNSLGHAVCGSAVSVKPFKKRKRYSPPQRFLTPVPSPEPAPKAEQAASVVCGLTISIPLAHRSFDIQVPADMPAEDVTALIRRFR